MDGDIICLIQSANGPQDPYPTLCTLGINVDWRPLFNVGSPVSWPTVLTACPTQINFISLSFCLMSRNSFSTCTQTMTFISLEIALIPDPHGKTSTELHKSAILRWIFLWTSSPSVFIVLGLYLYLPYFIYNNLFTPASHFIVASLRESVIFYSALSLRHQA